MMSCDRTTKLAHFPGVKGPRLDSVKEAYVGSMVIPGNDLHGMFLEYRIIKLTTERFFAARETYGTMRTAAAFITKGSSTYHPLGP